MLFEGIRWIVFKYRLRRDQKITKCSILSLPILFFIMCAGLVVALANSAALRGGIVVMGGLDLDLSTYGETATQHAVIFVFIIVPFLFC
jgi:hypothetical protein